MLTEAQKNFLRNKGVNEALGNLLANVRDRRWEREHSAEVLRRYRNYERTKKQYNASLKKRLNMNTNVRNQIFRLRQNPAHERILFRGQRNVNPATLRNRIQTLPKNVPKTVNMKEFVRRLNAYEAMKPNYKRNMNAYSEAMLQFIHVMNPPYGFNTSRFSPEQVALYANRLVRNLKYEKGKVIGRIVGNRVANPYTGIGRRMAMRRFPGN